MATLKILLGGLVGEPCHYGHHSEGVSIAFPLDATSELRIVPIQNVVFVLSPFPTVEQKKIQILTKTKHSCQIRQRELTKNYLCLEQKKKLLTFK
jgi:hypothetical protein